MAGKDQYTAQQMIDALTATKGMTTLAARRLQCSANTVRRYIDKYATVAEARRNAKEELDDQVELTLINMALGQRDEKGNYTREPNIASLIFYAKTQMRGRGYTERLDIGIELDKLREVMAAIESMNQEPAEVFNNIIRMAKEHAGRS